MATMRITSLLVLLMGLSAPAAAYDPLQVWHSSNEKDGFTNATTYSSYGLAGSDHQLSNGQWLFNNKAGYSIGLRCDVSADGSKDFMLTFRVDSSLATPNSDAYVYLKVDSNQPLDFLGRLYSNSYRSGFVRMTPDNRSGLHSFISQAKAGKTLSVRVHDKRRSDIEDYSVLLRGFTQHTAQALNACGVTPEGQSMGQQDQARLREIEAQLKALESEKAEILSRH